MNRQQHGHDDHDGHDHGDHGDHGAHDHEHAGHAHVHAHALGHRHVPSNNATLYAALALTLGYAGVEAVSGLMSGSLALVSDAGHMVTDAVALGIAAFAAWISRRPPSSRLTFGFMRAEIIAAVVNAGFMLALVAVIAGAAVIRMFSPQGVDGDTVIVVAGIGLLLNIAVAWLLSRGESNMNTRAAMLHVMGDLLGSVAALGSGLIIAYTGFTLIDPILSVFICALILVSSLRLLRDGTHALMEGVPMGVSLEGVGKDMAGVAGVASVHDLHIWALSSDRTVLSAHVVVNDLSGWNGVLDRMMTMLGERYRIEHVTLQPEIAGGRLYQICEPGTEP